MRKGDQSRKKIIDAAEKLFAEKGYAATSVQDILNALDMSKGGFYHYFDTKMELLTEVCARRTEESYSRGVEYVRGMRGGPVEKLNAAVKLVNMLDREGPAMLGTLTEMGMSGDDALVLRKLRDTTMRMVAPLIEEIIDVGVREKQFTVRRPRETARMITLLALDVNEEAARDIADNFRSPDCAFGVLDMLTTYRSAIETLVNAPYGSIELFDLAEMVQAVTRIAEKLNAEAAQRV